MAELKQCDVGQPVYRQPSDHGHADKGYFNGSCNRMACQAPGATWYNQMTKSYYCAPCAASINYLNRNDGFGMICVAGDHGDPLTGRKP